MVLIFIRKWSNIWILFCNEQCIGIHLFLTCTSYTNDIDEHCIIMYTFLFDMHFPYLIRSCMKSKLYITSLIIIVMLITQGAQHSHHYEYIHNTIRAQ